MQVYRRMEIGTAKPTLEQRRIVPHHLIDLVDPDEPFDAARYVHFAGPVIEDMRERGKLPLVVGGTGLYMKVLTLGLCPGPASDPEVKRRLIADEKSKGPGRLYSDLLLIDPESAARIAPTTGSELFGRSRSFTREESHYPSCREGHGFKEQLLPTIKIFINLEREALYERINRRVRPDDRIGPQR